MHNNTPPIKRTHATKESYTVVEAAVQWARAEGAKTAGDPRINQYSQLLLESLKNGELHSTGESLSDKPSLSSAIASADLKQWMQKHVPDARPAFLFKPKS